MAETATELKPVIKPETRHHIAHRITIGGRNRMGDFATPTEQKGAETLLRVLAIEGYPKTLKRQKELVDNGKGRDIQKKGKSFTDTYGLTRNPETGEKILKGPEKERHDKIKELVENINTFLNGGKGIDNLEQEKKDELKKILADSLSADSTLGHHFNGMTDTEKLDTIEELVQRPNYLHHLREHFAQVLSRESDFVPEEDILKTKEEIALAKVEIDDISRQIGTCQNEFIRTQERINEISESPERTVSSPLLDRLGRPSVLAERNAVLTSEQQNLSNLEKTLQQRMNQDSTVNTEIQDLTDQLNGLAPIEITQWGTSKEVSPDQRREMYQSTLYQLQGKRKERKVIEKHKQEIQERIEQQKLKVNNLLQEVNAAAAERAGLPQHQNQLLVRLTELEKAKIKAQAVLEKNRIKLHDLLQKRANQEQACSDDLQIGRIFADALQSQLIEEINDSISILEREDPAIGNEVVKDARDTIERSLKARYIKQVERRRGLFRRREYDHVLNERQIISDYRLLVHGEPAALMKKILSEPMDTTELGRVIKLRGVPSAEEGAIASIMGNEAFVKAMSPEVVKIVLEHYLTLRKPTIGDLRRIETSTWGRGMIEQSLRNNAQFRETVQQYTGSKDLDMRDPSFQHRLAGMFRDHPALLLIPFTGIPWLLWELLKGTGENLADIGPSSELRDEHAGRLAA